MPHERPRYALHSFLKKARLWPVLGLLGARQVGKSTLLREQLLKRLGAKYLLLDRKSLQIQATKAPEHFVKSHSNNLKTCLILDEVQKAGDLFDAIKAEVDENRMPGRFILSGSTEFSKRTGIRESLTGRIGITHLYPFTLAEFHGFEFDAPWVSLKVKSRCQPSDIDSYLEKGGMPGVCFIRNVTERKSYFDGWLDTTCYRDLQQIKGAKLEGTFAFDILYALAGLEKPSVLELKKKLRTDSRKIVKHLEGLAALFIIYPIAPHSLGVGKTQYRIFDCGLANHLGASLETRRKIWVTNECFAQFEYSGLPRPKLTYYESTKHSSIPVILDDRKTERAILISDEEAPSTFTLRALKVFLVKSPKTLPYVFAPLRDPFTDENKIRHLPWTAMV